MSDHYRIPGREGSMAQAPRVDWTSVAVQLREHPLEDVLRFLDSLRAIDPSVTIVLGAPKHGAIRIYSAPQYEHAAHAHALEWLRLATRV